jgi:hypothetical protein
MRQFLTPRALWPLGLLVVTSLTVGQLVSSPPTPKFADLISGNGEDEEEEEGLPPALARRMERLKSLPGADGDAPDGRFAADAEKFLSLAYPADDIALENLNAARAAGARIKGKDFPSGKGRKGTWISVGPSHALYPATIFRSSFSYVPARYMSGGRVTALAIDPNCALGNCRLWIFSAGGGIWRTKNALTGQPSWEFLSGDFGIQSGSSIALDPNDSTGDTLYVGTGESNSSSDSAAGVGLFKSTDGGTTWTGPLGAASSGGRSIGSIAVVPGSPNTIYAATTRGVLGVTSVNGGAVSLIPGAAAWGLYKSTDGGSTWTFLHNGAARWLQRATPWLKRRPAGRHARCAAFAVSRSIRRIRPPFMPARTAAACGAR